jgi:hypothetical protein
MTPFAARRRMLATMLLALWWGGFTFYAGRVVFIGHEVLRSKIRQGFITERVTTELNWLAAFTLSLVAWELAAGRNSIRSRRWPWMALGVAVATTIVLFVLHAKLVSELDFPARQVAADNFYDWHRAYLWTASMQWLAGTALLVGLHSALCPTIPSNGADFG